MKFQAVLLAAILFAAADNRAQPGALGGVKDLHAPAGFTSEQYFEPPHEQQVKMRLSGAAAEPLPGGLLDVKELRVEMFTTDGRNEAVVQAPQCTYAPFDGVASSAGSVALRSGDGKTRVTGDGFWWRQSDNSLTISNHVHMVSETGILKF
jgi:hypothetical protein